MRSLLFVLVAVSLLFFSRTALAECTVGLHAGIDDDDVPAIEQIVCREVAALPAGPSYRVDVARLGSKIVLSLTADGRTPKHLVLSSLDEVPVAAPRLVESLGDERSVPETASVTNVVGNEARPMKKKTGEIHGWLGAVGAVATSGGSGAGAVAGLSAGSARWSFVLDLRIAGGDVTFVALSGGVRHRFGEGEVAPFLTMGLSVAGIEVDRTNRDGSGMAVHLEAGLDVLRTSQFGGAIVARVDVPTFADDSRPIPPILGLGFLMRF